MKRFLIVLCLFFYSLSSLVWATDKTPTQGLYWQLERDGAQLFLLGSIHAGRADMYPLPEYVMHAYEQSDALVVEINVKSGDVEQMSESMLELGLYPPGETLLQHMGKAEWQRFSTALEKAGMSEMVFMRQRPWFASMMLTIFSMKQAGFDEKLGVDWLFISKAYEKKPIIELESIAQQTRFLAELPEATQLVLLNETVRQLDDSNAYYQRMLTLWRRGDAAGMERFMDESMGDDQTSEILRHVLLTQRNVAMTEKLLKLAQPGTRHFVVVGAGHFVGEDGIVRLLQQQGFKILPIK